MCRGGFKRFQSPPVLSRNSKNPMNKIDLRLYSPLASEAGQGSHGIQRIRRIRDLLNKFVDFAFDPSQAISLK
jgi:hypothetical protein